MYNQLSFAASGRRRSAVYARVRVSRRDEDLVIDEVNSVLVSVVNEWTSCNELISSQPKTSERKRQVSL